GSAQKALSTSTRMSAVCAGSAFWGSVVSMGDILSGLPDHGVDVERLCELLAHQDVEVSLQGGDVELIFGRPFEGGAQAPRHVRIGLDPALLHLKGRDIHVGDVA